MASIIDPRSAKTEERIIEAYINLLLKGKSDACSIRAICDESKIHKSTFYRHFQNISDVQRNIESQVIQRLEALSQDIDLSDFIQGRESFLKRLNSEIKKNQSFYKKLLMLNSNITFLLKIKNQIIKRMIETALKNSVMSPIQIKIFYTYVVSGTIAVYREWIQRGCIENIDSISSVLKSISSSGVLSLYNNSDANDNHQKSI